MSKIQNRYASAVHSGNLRSRASTEMSDSDMLGAAGFAGRATRTELINGEVHRRPGSPLAVALARLFAGDDREARHIVQLMASLAWGKAKAEGVRLKRVQAADMATVVLEWFRHGTCDSCGGHGYKVAGGRLGESRAVISDAPCDVCRGSRKVNFDRLFVLEQLLVARWLRQQVEREQAAAGAEIMKALAPLKL